MTQTQDLPVDLEDAMRGMPMQTRSGEVLLGFPAMRRAILQTPLGFLPAMILYLPGISALGRIVYNRTAEKRAREISCSIAPETRD